MIQSIKLVFFFAIYLLFQSSSATENPLNSALETVLSGQKAGVKSQNHIDEIADETRDMIAEYRNLLRSIDSLSSYNKQLKKITSDQTQQIASVNKQLNEIEETQREIVPLMLKMIAVLEQFITLDLPFLQDERQQRLALLKQIMDRSDVNLPDKYRRILEAYQIEIEYGRTIESYTDTILVNNTKNTVDVLRIGRISLVYVSLDNRKVGFWNKQSKQWQELPNSYLKGVQEGIKIAKKQSPPELFPIPIIKQGAES